MIEIDVRDVLNRVAQEIGASADAVLAREFGVTPQTFSTWKTRGKIPFEHICAVAEERGISLDYLLLGRGGPHKIGQDLDVHLMQQIASTLVEAQKDLPISFLGRPEDYVYYSALIYEKVQRLAPEQRLSAVPQEAAYLMRIFAKQMLLMNPDIRSSWADIVPELEKLAGTTVPATNRTITQDERERLMEGLSPEKDFLDGDAGHEARAATPAVHQEIRGRDHQIAGRDLVNNSGKGNKKK